MGEKGVLFRYEVEEIMERKTSEEWQKLCKIKVLDPDGWDRHGDFDFSWYKEKITAQEFEQRLISSTCEFNQDDLGDIWRQPNE